MLPWQYTFKLVRHSSYNGIVSSSSEIISSSSVTRDRRLLPWAYTFKYIPSSRVHEIRQGTGFPISQANSESPPIALEAHHDDDKRLFLKLAGLVGLGVVASSVIPKQAEAYVMGSAPTSNVVGLKNAANTRINPATEDTLSSLISGQGVTKLSINLSSSGNVRTPGSGKKIRVYASRFSLTADATSVAFRFTSGGTDYEKYVSPKAGGLYGANNHPNYIEGGVNEVLYCSIVGTTTVQINIDYLEV